MQHFIDFVKSHHLLDSAIETHKALSGQSEVPVGHGQAIIHATGGGAYKYADLFEREFEGQVKLNKYDEM